MLLVRRLVSALAVSLMLPAVGVAGHAAQANASETNSLPGYERLTPRQKSQLADLQREVRATVDSSHGKQTAVNEVTSADGNTVMTFPVPVGMEFLNMASVSSIPRNLASSPAPAPVPTPGFGEILSEPLPATPSGSPSNSPAAQPLARTVYKFACPEGTRDQWVCLYENPNFNGLQEDATSGPGNGRLLKWKDNGYKKLAAWSFANAASSWVNMKGRNWRLYDWLRGNPNCGDGDFGNIMTLTHNSRLGALGAMNDKTDCLVDG